MRLPGGGGPASIDPGPWPENSTGAWERQCAPEDTWPAGLGDRPRGWTQADEVPTLADLAP